MKPVFLARCALFSALMCICAWISIPTGSLSFTLQTFALFLALLTLGGKGGTVSVAVYLALGAVGLPVFSGFRGGIGALLGVTGGYLWGFLVGCLAFWLIRSICGVRFQIIAVITAILSVYICGTVWFMVYVPGGLFLILAQSVLPYLIPDAVKILLAFWIAKRLKTSFVRE